MPGPPEPRTLSRRHFLQAAGAGGAGLALGPSTPTPTGTASRGAPPGPGALQVRSEGFAVAFEDGAMVGLKAVDDPSETEWIQPGQRLGDVLIRYRTGSGDWALVESGKGRSGEPWGPVPTAKRPSTGSR